MSDKGGHDDDISLQEMLDDPIVQALMASDGVAREDVEYLVERLRARRHSGQRGELSGVTSEVSDFSGAAPTDAPFAVRAGETLPWTYHPFLPGRPERYL